MISGQGIVYKDINGNYVIRHDYSPYINIYFFTYPELTMVSRDLINKMELKEVTRYILNEFSSRIGFNLKFVKDTEYNEEVRKLFIEIYSKLKKLLPNQELTEIKNKEWLEGHDKELVLINELADFSFVNRPIADYSNTYYVAYEVYNKLIEIKVGPKPPTLLKYL